MGTKSRMKLNSGQKRLTKWSWGCKCGRGEGEGEGEGSPPAHCQRKKSLRWWTPLVRMRISRGGECGEVERWEARVCSVIELYCILCRGQRCACKAYGMSV